MPEPAADSSLVQEVQEGEAFDHDHDHVVGDPCMSDGTGKAAGASGEH